MKPLRLAVVGGGHLGKIHARLAASLPEFELAAIVEPDDQARHELSRQHGAQPLTDHRELLGEVDAAVIAAPTSLHHQIAGDLLRGGIHTLVEKPLTLAVAEADELVKLARHAHLVLQTGHVERFNPALLSVEGRLHAPRFIDARRMSGYTFRSTDVGVVHDLMIHDIDIVLSLVKSPVTQVEALGVAVLGNHEDMARARLRFACGAIADLTASRTSYRAERVMNVFADRLFASLDFATGTTTLVEPEAQLLARRFPGENLSAAQKQVYRDQLFDQLLAKTQTEQASVNAIEEELRDFGRSIRNDATPRVDGEAGRDAVAVAERVLEAIAAHAWDATGDRRGPLAMPLSAAQSVVGVEAVPTGDDDTVVLRPRRAA
jgi:predicted dehydrogenase